MNRRSLLARLISRSRTECRERLWNLQGGFRPFVTVKTSQGIYTLRTTDQGISRRLYCEGHYESRWMGKVVDFLRAERKCPPAGEGTLIDIGANNGITSIPMVLNHKVARSVAIEPEPGNFSLLKENIRRNGLEEKVLCLPYAISDRASDIPFELSEGNLGDHRVRMPGGSEAAAKFDEPSRKVIRVKSICLDDLISELPPAFAGDITLVWIDVQGHEGHVFSGGKRFFERDLPVVSEFWPYGIKRSGMSQADYTSIVSSLWSHYWMAREWRGRLKFVKYPIGTLDILFEEIGSDGVHTNVIYMK